jgi:hypothetical protein
MARTTATEVKEILDTSLSDIVVDSYINIANALVTDELSSSTLMSDTQLEEIERWLTAHLIASTRARMGKSEKLGDASITYTGEFGMGLDSTPYGQMVKLLDKTGSLAAMGKKKITFKAITSFED